MRRHDYSSWLITAATIAAVSFCLGCAATSKRQPPAKARPLIREVDKGQSKRKALEAKYKGMSVTDLSKELEADSAKDVEPFNSPAYREIISRGQRTGAELAAFVTISNRTSFLSLLAVRKIDPSAYGSISIRTKTPILIDALRTSKFFNTWGLPHLYWEDAAKGIIELKENAVEPLNALLKDKRSAPVWGSEEAMEYSKYKYRVCDYAWALLMEIQQRKVQIPTDPNVRDTLMNR
jgi:hypothetical protein